MDRFEAMSLLVAVSDAGSFSAASRALKVPLATLSRKIAELEALIGARLLTRTTRRLSLTDAGTAYVAAARRILEQVEEAEREVAGEFTTPKGELVVTAPLMFGRLHVLPVVAEFLAAFPQIDVRLLLADHNLHLAEDHVDMAVRIGALPNSTLVATGIGTMRLVTCASPALLAGHGVPDRPDALPALPTIAYEMPSAVPAWRYRVPGSSEPLDVPVRSRLLVSTTEAAVDAATRGIGVVRLLHYQVAEAIQRGALTLILEDFEPEPAPVHLVHAARGQMPLKMRRFLDLAAPRLRGTLAKLSQGRAS
ncbi:LysR substrate-binding domain-containing protein [Ancylobacter sp. A5.8]|uniref:LysR substrate-binding domain-containing protein n=1 Tax=Ancylobacter gelatini TaxID=2919920 RepID=UPI001F4E2D1A|nr:LysR substrate-binding domain-containing protein [Ancylobacter gelatini]MCJ8143449.1 LysR substrate-binding domain-containing protein [Ancylobacter gelatini]